MSLIVTTMPKRSTPPAPAMRLRIAHGAQGHAWWFSIPLSA